MVEYRECTLCGCKFEVDPYHPKAEWCWVCIMEENGMEED